MFGVRVATSRDARGERIDDPEAAAAYHSLREIIASGCDDDPTPEIAHLKGAVLRSYAQALGEWQPERRSSAWAAFVRRATLLSLVLDRRTEPRRDPDRERALNTLRQIAHENADLLAG